MRAGCTGGARLLDLCNPFDVLNLQVTAAFENFQRVFFVGEAQPLGFPDAERDDAGRGIAPGRAMRGFPIEVVSDSAVAPFRYFSSIRKLTLCPTEITACRVLVEVPSIPTTANSAPVGTTASTSAMRWRSPS